VEMDERRLYVWDIREMGRDGQSGGTKSGICGAMLDGRGWELATSENRQQTSLFLPSTLTLPRRRTISSGYGAGYAQGRQKTTLFSSPTRPCELRRHPHPGFHHHEQLKLGFMTLHTRPHLLLF
jgi:hypothetical protein